MERATSKAGQTRTRSVNPRGQGERLRVEIIDAAGALVAEPGGARGLTLRAVAKRVGIAPTSVYLHFPDVDALKVAVVERGFVEMDRARNAAEKDVADSAVALRARWRAYCHFALEHPGHYRLMFGPEVPAPLAFQQPDSPGRASFLAAVRGIERCQSDGTSTSEEAPFRLAALAWCAVHGLVLLRIDRPGFPWPPLDEMLDETLTRLLGLRPLEAPSTGRQTETPPRRTKG